MLEWWPYTYQAIGEMKVLEGDSGGPVWQCGTGKAIGVLGSDNGRALVGISSLYPPLPPDAEGTLYPYEFKPDQAPGILKAPGMGDIHLVTAG